MSKLKRTNVIIHRVIHKGCGHPFYEVESDMLGKCPRCHKKIETEDVEITHKKHLFIDKHTGELGYS